MTFGITIASDAWRRHTGSVRDRVHGADAALVPVIKANGYGLGQALLAREATRLGVRAIAVGTVHEVRSVVHDFAGDVIVLEPVDPRDESAAAQWAELSRSELGPRLVATVATSRGLDLVIDTFAHPRVVLEGLTSMRRFGFEGPKLHEAWKHATEAAQDGRLRLHGLSVHLPLEPTSEDFDEVLQLADEVADLDNSAHIMISHVDVPQLEILRRHNPRLRFSLRLGTSLWLGDRTFLQSSGTVLAVHRVRRGQPIGYSQRKARSDGFVVVVSGGTSHGVSLQAPSATRTLRERIVTLANGALNAGGHIRSPFQWHGSQLTFVEPPHQLVSLVWVPAHGEAPGVGSPLLTNVRYTITHADVVQLS